MLTLHFDGLFRAMPLKSGLANNAGFMCYGWLITRNGVIIARGHGGYARGRGANANVAEYLALLEGLEALLDMNVSHEMVEVVGDAKSVIDQMEGYANVSSEDIKPLYGRARRLARNIQRIQWRWLPRRYNQEADLLTKRAMKQIYNDQESYLAALEMMDPQTSPHGNRKKIRSLLDLRIYQPKGLGALA
jgi:ribonuclease HI